MPSPIPELAEHLRRAIRRPETNSTLSIPKELLAAIQTAIAPSSAPFTTPEIEDLVDSLGLEFETWLRLDAPAIGLLALIFMRTEEPSSAQSEGLCTLYKIMEDPVGSSTNRTSGTAQSRHRFKTAVAKGILKPLFDFFVVGGPEMGLAQRWAGLLLWELLEAKTNCGRLLGEVEGSSERMKTGRLIVEGNDKLLKVVAGMVIRRLADNLESPGVVKKFIADSFPEEILNPYEARSDEFPLGSGSQWYQEFGMFVAEVEAKRDELNAPTPMGFHGTALQIGQGFVNSGGITCGLNSRRLSIHVSASTKDSSGAGWYDIELENIDRITFEGVFEKEPDQQTNLVLHLVDFREQDFLFMYNMERRNEQSTFRIRIFLDESAVISSEIQTARDDCRRRIDPAGFVMKISKPGFDILSIEPGAMSQEQAEEIQNQRREETMKNIAGPPSPAVRPEDSDQEWELHPPSRKQTDTAMETQDSMLDAILYEDNTRKGSKPSRPSTRAAKSTGTSTKSATEKPTPPKTPLGKAGTGNKLKDRMTFPINVNKKKQYDDDSQMIDPGLFPEIESAQEEEEEEVPTPVPAKNRAKKAPAKKATQRKAPAKNEPPKKEREKKDSPKKEPPKETPKHYPFEKEPPKSDATKKDRPKKKPAPPQKKPELKESVPPSDADIYDFPESGEELEIETPAKPARKGAQSKPAATKGKKTAARKAPVKAVKAARKPAAPTAAAKKKAAAAKEASTSTALAKNKPQAPLFSHDSIAHPETDNMLPDSPEAVFTKKTVVKLQTIKTTTTTVTKSGSQTQQPGPAGKKRPLNKTSHSDFGPDEREPKRKKPLDSPPPTAIRRSARIQKNPPKKVETCDEDSSDSELSDVPSPQLPPTIITPKTGTRPKKGQNQIEELELPKPAFELSKMMVKEPIKPVPVEVQNLKPPQDKPSAPEALIMAKDVEARKKKPVQQHKPLAPEAPMMIKGVDGTKEKALQQKQVKETIIGPIMAPKDNEPAEEVKDSVTEDDLMEFTHPELEDFPESSAEVLEQVDQVKAKPMIVAVAVSDREVLRMPVGKVQQNNSDLNKKVTISPISIPLHAIFQTPVKRASEKKSESTPKPTKAPAVPQEQEIVKKHVEKVSENHTETSVKSTNEKQPVKTPVKKKMIVSPEDQQVEKTELPKREAIKKPVKMIPEKEPESNTKPVTDKQLIKTPIKPTAVVPQGNGKLVQKVQKTEPLKSQKAVEPMPDHKKKVIIEEDVDSSTALQQDKTNKVPDLSTFDAIVVKPPGINESVEPSTEDTPAMVQQPSLKPAPETLVCADTQQSSASQTIEVEHISFSQLNESAQESAKKVLGAANLERKPQIIQWGKHGPKNQGGVRLEAKSTSPKKKTVIVPPRNTVKAAIQAGFKTPEVPEKVIPKKRELEQPTGSQEERNRKRAKKPLLESEEEEDSDEDLYSVPKPNVVVKPTAVSKIEKKVMTAKKDPQQKVETTPKETAQHAVQPEMLLASQKNPEAFKTPQRRRPTADESGSPLPKGSSVTTKDVENFSMRSSSEDSNKLIGTSQTRHISISSSVEESDDDPFVIPEKEIDELVDTDMDMDLKTIKKEQFISSPEPEPEIEDAHPIQELRTSEPTPEPVIEVFAPKPATQGVRRKINFSSSMEVPPVEKPKPKPKLGSAFKDLKSVKFALEHTEIDSSASGLKPPAAPGTPFKAKRDPNQGLFRGFKHINSNKDADASIAATKSETKKILEAATPKSTTVQGKVVQLALNENRTRKSVSNNDAVRRASKSLQDVLKILAPPPPTAVVAPAKKSTGPTKITGKSMLQKAVEQTEMPHVGEKAQKQGPAQTKLPPFKKPTMVGPVMVRNVELPRMDMIPSRKHVPTPMVKQPSKKDLEKEVEADNPPTPPAEEYKGGRFFAEMADKGLIPSSQPPSNNGGFDENDETLVNPDSDSEDAGSDPDSSDSDSSNSQSHDHESSDSEHDEYPGEHRCTDWIHKLPERHQGIAGALTTLTQYWIKYLMSAEERAEEVVKEFGEKAESVVERLSELHQEDYNSFVDRYNMELSRVREACGEAEGTMGSLMGEWGALGLVKAVKEEGKQEWEALMGRLEGLVGK